MWTLIAPTGPTSSIPQSSDSYERQLFYRPDRLHFSHYSPTLIKFIQPSLHTQIVIINWIDCSLTLKKGLLIFPVRPKSSSLDNLWLTSPSAANRPQAIGSEGQESVSPLGLLSRQSELREDNSPIFACFSPIFRLFAPEIRSFVGFSAVIRVLTIGAAGVGEKCLSSLSMLSRGSSKRESTWNEVSCGNYGAWVPPQVVGTTIESIACWMRISESPKAPIHCWIERNWFTVFTPLPFHWKYAIRLPMIPDQCPRFPSDLEETRCDKIPCLFYDSPYFSGSADNLLNSVPRLSNGVRKGTVPVGGRIGGGVD